MKKLLILFPIWFLFVFSFCAFDMFIQQGTYRSYDGLSYLFFMFCYLVLSVLIYILSALVFKPLKCFGSFLIIFSICFIFQSFAHNGVCVNTLLELVAFVFLDLLLILFLKYIEDLYPPFKSNYVDFKKWFTPKWQSLKDRWNRIS